LCDWSIALAQKPFCHLHGDTIPLVYSAPSIGVFLSSMCYRTCPSGPADRFAVLDYEDDELDELPLFQPSAATGLTDEIVEGITTYLSGKTDRDMRCNRVKRFLQNMHAVFKGHEG
jgi:hypothetical protein